jgi:hypothetical protein
MPGALEQVGSGDVAIENRDPRFAELDAQNVAENTARQQKPIPKPKRAHRPGPRLPAPIARKLPALPVSYDHIASYSSPIPN